MISPKVWFRIGYIACGVALVAYGPVAGVGGLPKFTMSEQASANISPAEATVVYASAFVCAVAIAAVAISVIHLFRAFRHDPDGSVGIADMARTHRFEILAVWVASAVLTFTLYMLANDLHR